MPGKFFTSEGAFSNTDIDDIFEPLGAFTKGPDVGYLDAGQDISNLYAPVTVGSPSANIGFFFGGTDLGQLFAALGTAASDAQIVGPSELNEGVTQQYTFSGTNVPSQVYFWRVNHITTSSADFSGAALNSSNPFNYLGSPVNFSITTVADGLTEGSESFEIQISSTDVFAPGDIIVEREIIILDTSTTPASYEFIAPIPTDVNEGATASFTIQGTNAPAQTLYWTVETLTNTNTGQFSPPEGAFNITSPNAFDGFNGTFNVNTVADQLTAAGAQTFRINVRTGSLGGTIVATSPSITLNDTSQTPVTPTTYSVDLFAAASYPEGQTMPLLLNVSDGTPGSYVYHYRVIHISTTQNDFVLNQGTMNVTVDGAGNASTPLNVSTVIDFTQAGVSEGNETYQVQVRTAPFPGGTVLGTSPVLTVTNVGTDLFIPLRTAGGTTFTIGSNNGITLQDAINGIYDVTEFGVMTAWDIIGTGASPAVPGDFVASSGTFLYTGEEDLPNSDFFINPVLKPAGSPAKTFRVRIRASTTGGTIIGQSAEFTIPVQVADDSFQVICGHAARGGPNSIGTITSSITFNTNGTVTTSGSAPSSIDVVDWKTPTQTGVGNSYQIRAELVQGVSGIPSSTAALTGPALGSATWHTLSSARTWTNTRSTAGTAATILRFTIRRLSDSTVMTGPANTYLVATNQTAFPELGGHCALVPQAPPPPPPPPPGGGGSVSVYAYMPNTEKKAGEMVAGDELMLLSLDREGTMSGTVISNRTSMQNLVTLVSASGIRLTCSDNTPLTLRDGSSINSTEALGQFLPVQDDEGFRWEEIVAVEDAGQGEVATIWCENQIYAAGDEPGRWILTHNLQKN